MNQSLVLFFLTAFCLNQSFAGHTNESYVETFKCKWLKSESHTEGYFIEDTGFEIHFTEDNKAYFTNDSFFFRRYSPCWVGGYSSCVFDFSYDRKDFWVVDHNTNTLTQVWRREFTTDYNDGLPEENGTVDGVSIIQISYNTDRTTRFYGDDGDGVTFNEKFKCELK